jgi:hypothetical protein
MRISVSASDQWADFLRSLSWRSVEVEVDMVRRATGRGGEWLPGGRRRARGTW